MIEVTFFIMFVHTCAHMILKINNDEVWNKIVWIGMENYKESDDQWDAFSLSLLPISSLFGNSPNTIKSKK